MCYFRHMKLYLIFFFIFLLHFRCDEFPFFQKWIDQKDRYQYLKQKQKRFLSSVQESRSTNPFLQSVHIIMKGTLVPKWSGHSLVTVMTRHPRVNSTVVFMGVLGEMHQLLPVSCYIG